MKADITRKDTSEKESAEERYLIETARVLAEISRLNEQYNKDLKQHIGLDIDWC